MRVIVVLALRLKKEIVSLNLVPLRALRVVLRLGVVVQRIDEFLAGPRVRTRLSFYPIAARLNAEGVPTRTE